MSIKGKDTGEFILDELDNIRQQLFDAEAAAPHLTQILDAAHDAIWRAENRILVDIYGRS